MPLIFRAAGPADAPELAALHVSTWREAYSHLLPGDFFTDEYIEGRQKMWNHVLNNPREEWTIRVAQSPDSIIGLSDYRIIGFSDSRRRDRTSTRMMWNCPAHVSCSLSTWLLIITARALARRCSRKR